MVHNLRVLNLLAWYAKGVGPQTAFPGKTRIQKDKPVRMIAIISDKRGTFRNGVNNLEIVSKCISYLACLNNNWNVANITNLAVPVPVEIPSRIFNPGKIRKQIVLPPWIRSVSGTPV